jgi:hypothetical protein
MASWVITEKIVIPRSGSLDWNFIIAAFKKSNVLNERIFIFENASTSGKS